MTFSAWEEFETHLPDDKKNSLAWETEDILRLYSSTYQWKIVNLYLQNITYINMKSSQ